jgi:ElaB/YqjD/DUF883 family membrane-anchored ribosome-binding protein
MVDNKTNKVKEVTENQDDVMADAIKVLEEAKAEAEKLVKEAKAEAEKLVKEAKAEAESIPTKGSKYKVVSNFRHNKDLCVAGTPYIGSDVKELLKKGLIKKG